MKSFKPVVVLSFALVLAVALPSPAALPQSQPRYGGTLIAALADDPPDLDPHFTAANASHTVLHNIFATLVDVDENLNIVPELAHSWEVSEDGMTYIFYLRDDVTFHDGTPFNAGRLNATLTACSIPSSVRLGPTSCRSSKACT